MTTIKVKKSDEKPESKEILAAAIVRISESMEKLLASGINTKAIIVLIHHETKIPQKDIKAVLDAMNRLKGWYCRG